MSNPFLIWTMRRTGGTSLAALINKYARFPVLHEPFNSGRPWNDLVVAYDAAEAGKEPTLAIEQILHSRLSGQIIVKNCYDLHKLGLHQDLMRTATSLGYKHVILDRHNEEDRILSLALAAQTGAWGKATAETVYPDILEGRRRLDPLKIKRVLGDRERAHARRLWLHKTMQEAGIKPIVVFFEDIYNKGAEGEQFVRDLFDALAIPKEPPEIFEKDLHSTVQERSQGSARLLSLVPNIKAVRRALSGTSEWPNPFVQLR